MHCGRRANAVGGAVRNEEAPLDCFNRGYGDLADKTTNISTYPAPYAESANDRCLNLNSEGTPPPPNPG